jgi:upstream stimulatory factor
LSIKEILNQRQDDCNVKKEDGAENEVNRNKDQSEEEKSNNQTKRTHDNQISKTPLSQMCEKPQTSDNLLDDASEPIAKRNSPNSNNSLLSLSPYLKNNELFLNSTNNNNQENVYFMMQTANDLLCGSNGALQQTSSPVSSSFKTVVGSSPAQATPNRLFLSQQNHQNVLPSIATLHNSPMVSTAISLAAASHIESPSTMQNLKDSTKHHSFTSSSGSSNLSVNSSSSSSNNNNIQGGVKGVRDEKRRANHNEVERRRRDNINKWIVELSKVIPDCSTDQSKHGQSKGGILEKTVQYLLDMKEENFRLIDHIRSLEKLKYDNDLLVQQNDFLQKENDLLKSNQIN